MQCFQSCQNLEFQMCFGRVWVVLLSSAALGRSLYCRWWFVSLHADQPVLTAGFSLDADSPGWNSPAPRRRWSACPVSRRQASKASSWQATASKFLDFPTWAVKICQNQLTVLKLQISQAWRSNSLSIKRSAISTNRTLPASFLWCCLLWRFLLRIQQRPGELHAVRAESQRQVTLCPYEGMLQRANTCRA